MDDANFLTIKTMEIIDRLSALSMKVDGFVQAQTSANGEIEKIHADIARIKADVAGLKHEKAKQRAYLTGISTVLVSIWGTFQYFIWPAIKEKLGF